MITDGDTSGRARPGLAENENTMPRERGTAFSSGFSLSASMGRSRGTYFNDVDDPEAQAIVARIGPEAVADHKWFPAIVFSSNMLWESWCASVV